jgi:hypothetical protein
MLAACLNPMPDDFPSGQGGQPDRNPDATGNAGSGASGGAGEPTSGGGAAGSGGFVDQPPPGAPLDPVDAGAGDADAAAPPDDAGDAGDAGITP